MNRTSFKRRILTVTVITAISFAVIATNGSATATEPAEQVVFSGIGFADEGFRSRFGFWVWCAADGNGPYADARICAGSVYLYRINLTVGVNGYMIENADETYTMHIFSNHEDLLSASLRNVSPEPVAGPNNVVEFEVVSASGVSRGDAPDSVVIVTGPEN